VKIRGAGAVGIQEIRSLRGKEKTRAEEVKKVAPPPNDPEVSKGEAKKEQGPGHALDRGKGGCSKEMGKGRPNEKRRVTGEVSAMALWGKKPGVKQLPLRSSPLGMPGRGKKGPGEEKRRKEGRGSGISTNPTTAKGGLAASRSKRDRLQEEEGKPGKKAEPCSVLQLRETMRKQIPERSGHCRLGDYPLTRKKKGRKAAKGKSTTPHWLDFEGGQTGLWLTPPATGFKV